MKKRKPAPKPTPATGTKGPKGLPNATTPALPPETILKGNQTVGGTRAPIGLSLPKLPELPPETILKGNQIVGGTRAPIGLSLPKLPELPPGTILKGNQIVGGTRAPIGLSQPTPPVLPPGTILKGNEIVGEGIMPVPNYEEAMARQIYQKMMDYQRQNIAAQNAQTSPSANFAADALRATQSAFMNNQAQARQVYQNLLNMGAAKYQAAMQQPLTPAPQPIQATRKNISTAKRTPPIQAF